MMNFTYDIDLAFGNFTDLENVSSADAAGLLGIGLILSSAAMVGIMVGAVFGNLLVITSVIKFQRLRALTNYFIVSLAFADLLVAVLVMPFNATISITGKWPFGRAMCDIFNANDVLFSTASILHLCCISMDRYIAIIHPLKYETEMTSTRVGVMLTVTWIASVCISYIPIHSQWYTTKENVDQLKDNADSCPFVVNTLYSVISSCVSFWIPCTIMVFVYFKIYLEARRQELAIRATTYHTSYSGGLLPNGSRGPDSSDQRYERRRMKREHKAAKTLGIIMGAFIACFLPFFSWYVITSICRDACPYPPLVGAVLFWVGYFNSCFNPIIYAYFNRDFRTAFKKLLRIGECGGGGCRREDPSGLALNATYTSDHRDSAAALQANYDRKIHSRH